MRSVAVSSIIKRMLVHIQHHMYKINYFPVYMDMYYLFPYLLPQAVHIAATICREGMYGRSYVHITCKVFTRHGKVYAPYTSVIYQTSSDISF